LHFQERRKSAWRERVLRKTKSSGRLSTGLIWAEPNKNTSGKFIFLVNVALRIRFALKDREGRRYYSGNIAVVGARYAIPTFSRGISDSCRSACGAAGVGAPTAARLTIRSETRDVTRDKAEIADAAGDIWTQRDL
jgi:hypothetical protein